jgi:hypothetical protein
VKKKKKKKKKKERKDDVKYKLKKLWRERERV